MDELVPEVGVEGSAIGDEGAGLGNITDELSLGLLELVSRSHPSDFVVSKGVDEPVGLVHLLASLGGSVSKLLFLCNFTVITRSKLSFDSVDLVKLVLCFLELCLGFVQGNCLDL